MSYPAPPPPGQSGPPGPGGPGQGTPPPYQPNPYGAGGNPYGPPPKKDNSTLWWILGIIGVVVIICCLGVCGFFGWFGNEVNKEIESQSSSQGGAQASGAQEVSEGSQATDDGATVRSGWSVTSAEDLSGVTLRNDGSSRDMVRVKFFFMQDGDVLEEATCSSKFLDPGETDYAPTCLDPIQSIDGYDEIRIAEGT